MGCPCKTIYGGVNIIRYIKVTGMKINALVIVLLLVSFSTVYASSVKEEYELQEHCKKSAVEFVQAQYKDWAGGMVTNYTNHYNRKLNKCFVKATFVRNEGFVQTTKTLWDINENNRYGEVVSGLFHPGTPIVCEMLGKWCKSESEWNSLAKPYMEE
jgi:hypothetical protein